MRAMAAKTKARRVAIVDKDGKVIRYTTVAVVQEGLLKAHKIEIEVDEGVRPKEIICKLCGKPVRVRNHKGKPPAVCRTACVRCACGRLVGKSSMSPGAIVIRNGRPPICWHCAITSEQRSELARRRTPEQRSESARKAHAARTPEQRSELARKMAAKRTPEQRAESARKGREAARRMKTPEQRAESTRKKSEGMRKVQAARTPEQRSELVRKAQAARTPEQRSESARKANAVRTPEQRAESARKVSEGMRKAHAAKTPEQRAGAARKASEAARKASVEKKRLQMTD